MTNLHTYIAVGIIALITAALRFLPFLIFRDEKSTPKIIEKLGGTLPYAIMGMLVIYCLREISFTSIAGFLPMIIACLIVGAIYIWRRNTLISIVTGTVFYMVLVQFVF